MPLLLNCRRGFAGGILDRDRRIVVENPLAAFAAHHLVALLQVLEELQAQLLDLIFEVVPAGRGAILLAEGSSQEFNSLYARTRQPGQPQLVRVSR